ncbi:MULTISPECIES: PDR/VanB family oxidoreductase [unclassified Arthrobacter]|uniref:PDR/VanB family oxidoreductase n=1 Tax=unclassified Arthrobacter TaxID=235627 RepID=UPI002882D4D8|nr:MULTISPECIES: PDR/VanB family oxidoreductase [unclassified Arthrobacter]
MGMFKVRVAEVLEETSKIKSFRLQRIDGAPFDPYAAGAHIDIAGPTDVVRQYSLCSQPDTSDDYLVAVKLEPESRGGSEALHFQVAVGHELDISAPRNLLNVVQDADIHVLMAAGIGVTPMISIAYHLHRTGKEFQLHYFAKSREEAAFCDLLSDKSGFGDRVHFHFGLKREDQPDVFRTAFEDLSALSHVYTCGPEGFMARVQELAGIVLPEGNVHIEHFQAGTPADASNDMPFEVELEGEVYDVPVGKSIVEVLAENDVEVDTTCQEGICGTCIMGVLKGEPDHRDQCMSASEKNANDQIAACVSRSKSARLILELF